MTTVDKQMVIHNLFPEPVGLFKLNRALTENEESFLRNQETRSNIGNTSSINSYILKSPIMVDLHNFIKDCVDNYFKFIYVPKHEVSLRLTQSWVNYTKQFQHHHQHTHGNSMISGVFYVNADKNTDKIFFFSKKPETFFVESNEYTIFNSTSWFLSVNTGDLLLFSSNLPHAVESVTSENTRISLAFNTFPVGLLGDDVTFTGVKL